MNRSINAAGILALTVLLAVSEAPARELSLDERVAAQKAIEQVYWSHRIWPKENPAPKPRLAAVLSDAAIRAKVEDYLKKSNALEQWWQRPVTAEQLQAELDRMAKNTRDGATLRELFGALGNDPFLIAETLGRQTLVERLIRNWYANDTRFHGDVKRKAERSLAACSSMDCMKTMDGDYRETTWRLRAGRAVDAAGPERNDAVRLDADEWQRQLGALAARLGATADALPARRVSRLEETPEAFVVTAVLAQHEGELKTASVSWTKRSFDSWWGDQPAGAGPEPVGFSGSFTLPEAPLTTCTNDAWRPTHVEVPDPREGHTAVWTGTEMIVWGGHASPGGFTLGLNTGGRYNPSTDTWTLTSTGPNVPAARRRHTVVWTGTEMIVWGGEEDNGTRIDTGGRYNPSVDAWATTSTTSVATARAGHSAVWTGTQMIVWGGFNNTVYLNTGGRYTPSTDTWTPTQTANAPAARGGPTAVWTGAKMIVWGGYDGAAVNTGGRYDPSTNSWLPTSTATAPTARTGHTAVWTGSLMIVWAGGNGGAPTVNTGGRYDPLTDTWAATQTTNVPVVRTEHTAVWTGTEMIVWGGRTANFIRQDTGGRYDPASNVWTATSMTNVPSGRWSHTAVWTGTEMIVWGGGPGYTNTGGRYVPSSDTWTATTTGVSVPVARDSHSAVWTGAEMIVWGGEDSERPAMNTGGRYDPSTDSWIATPLAPNVPTARRYQTAVWTGTEMIVWGGDDGSTVLGTGGRYNPSTNGWSATSIGANAPSERYNYTAVWTGTEMIIWGGSYNAAGVGTGGRYNPSTNSWRATSIGANAATARYVHTAVWTGTEMIVWGGYGTVPLNGGGRYKPSLDTWTAISTTNVPQARGGHTAVWTGTEMIVWGGRSNVGVLVSGGGRYEASTDTWTLVSTANAPPAGSLDAAVWTGTEMIVWGGSTDAIDFAVNSGGRYNPASDIWTATPTGANVPTARESHTAVWTGSEMIVWGGRPTTASGGGYCACLIAHTYYRDADGDGYGNAAVPTTACDAWFPAGYVANALDCDDANALVHPGAAESNDGFDNQCPGEPGYGLRDEIAGVFGFLTAGDKALLSWPPQAGANGYTVARSPYRDLHAGCKLTATGAASLIDIEVPAPGGSFYYLVRSADPNVGSWGVRSSGVERTVCAACENSGNSCDDGNACTTGDACSGTVCQTGSPRSCNDAQNCTDDSCNPSSGCVHTNITAACDDGSACTTGDTCGGGTCTAGPAANCDDSNPCTDDSCDPLSGCVHTNNATACSDGSACTTGDTCGGGTCHAGPAPNCDDGNPCTDDSCNPATGCVHANNSVPCSDGSLCTASDACAGGSCIPGAALNCSDSNPCTDDSCNPSSGCVHINNTTACSDGSACTTGDTCGGGSCISGAPLGCDDANPCTTDSCNPSSGCVHINNTTACSDGNACTTGDVCAGGVCAGTIPPGVGHLVISQIQIAGDGGGATDDEFIEIYNPTAVPVSVSGWSLQSVISTFPFNVDVRTLGTGSIPAHGWFLVVGPAYNGSVAADRANTVFTLPNSGNSVLLVNSMGGVSSCTSGQIVDKVAYGNGTCPENSAAPAPSANNSILRKPGGACGNGTDTNSNSSDFVSQTPSTPRNSASPPQP